MPAVDTVLLPLCVGLTLLGVIATGVAWRKGDKGRVVQGAGLALLPVALFFSGLLRLVWDAIVAVFDWASKIIFSPGVWFGLSLLGLCIVLWVVGGLVHRKFAPASEKKERKLARGAQDERAGSGKAVTGGQAQTAGQQAKAQQPKGKAPAKGQQPAGKKADPIDDDMAEIEALLKSRGIE